VDVDNYYDRIAHPMVSMVFQACGVPTPAIEAIRSTIQNMAFFLRTGYGDSSGYGGGFTGDSVEAIKFQGMCHGNGASPAAWAVTTIPMKAAHRKKGHGAHFMAPFSKISTKLIGGLVVDDTDLMPINMREEEETTSTHGCLQDAVVNWGKLLIATGGALKPTKCSYYLISFEWKADGKWKCADNTEDDDLSICIPLVDGSYEAIKQLPVSSAIKTLGSSALKRVQQQWQEWIDRIISGKVGRRSVWHMLGCQFWPRIGYVIGNNSASSQDLNNCLQRVYWQLLPRGGVRQPTAGTSRAQATQ
jgi:hypothetical protein